MSESTDPLCPRCHRPANAHDVMSGAIHGRGDCTLLESDVLRAEIERLVEFVRDVVTNYDHDDDAHRYNTPCRACEAEALLITGGHQ